MGFSFKNASWLGLLLSSACVAQEAAVKPQDNPTYQLLTRVPWVNLEKAPSIAQLEGRVILMDFWTFCCINCMHVISDLHRLEQEFGDKLLVLGIHSAKFENEKDSKQIVQAIAKYGIHHAVANDAQFLLWRALDIHAWPSFALLNADGRIDSITSGEGVYDKLHDKIAGLIKDGEKRKILKKNALTLSEARIEGPLRFPGKILFDSVGKRLFVSDSEHQKIRVLDLKGKELLSIGSGILGLMDGSFIEAQFHSPQGLALKGDLLYVADTDNHALRVVDLSKKTAKTINNKLNSPWDLEWMQDDLMIAMAGTHQIYRMHQGKLERFAGSGQENIADAGLGDAALAQTSGLSLGEDGRLYFVDSETSSLRFIEAGQVHTLVGEGLFEYGLIDGKAPRARLQHPLGVQAGKGKIYVADTYNHAIREYDLASKELRTLAGGKPGLKDGAFKDAQFREPNDLALVGYELFVTDTNNHAIRVIDLKKKTVRTLAIETLPTAPSASRFLPNLKIEKEIKSDTKHPFIVKWEVPKSMKLNPKTASELRLTGVQTPKNFDARMAASTETSFDLTGATDAATIEGTFYFCNADGTGACRIESLRLKIKSGGNTNDFDWRLGQ